MFSKQKDEIIIKENFNIAMIYSNSCSSPNQYEKNSTYPKGCVLFGAGNRTCRLLRLRLAYLWLGDRCKATVPASPLFTKNSPPDCFINAQTFTGSSPNQYEKTAHTPKGVCCLVQVTGLEPARFPTRS